MKKIRNYAMWLLAGDQTESLERYLQEAEFELNGQIASKGDIRIDYMYKKSEHDCTRVTLYASHPTLVDSVYESIDQWAKRTGASTLRTKYH